MAPISLFFEGSIDRSRRVEGVGLNRVVVGCLGLGFGLEFKLGFNYGSVGVIWNSFKINPELVDGVIIKP
jgi:hypothetical protein